MTLSILAFILAVVLLGIHTFVVLPTHGWRKYAGSIGFSIVCLSALFGFSQTLGSCLPEFAAKGTKMDVLAILYDQPNHIYLWGIDGNSPKCVALPWNEEQAIQIRGHEGDGEQLEYVWGDGPESEGAVHPKPQEALPPKDMQ